MPLVFDDPDPARITARDFRADPASVLDCVAGLHRTLTVEARFVDERGGTATRPIAVVMSWEAWQNCLEHQRRNRDR
jgi:hypothetical protein